MATIAQTLLDIEQVQQDIQKQLGSKKLELSKFIEDIRNITAVYQFDLLAHSSLDVTKAEFSGTANPYLQKYRSLSRKDEMHEEYIRWLNIGGLFVVCNIFERFVKETHGKICNGMKARDIKHAYEHILQRRNIENQLLRRMVKEFNLIRYVRNSLYQGDTYTNPKTREFVLGEETYELEKGKPVKPIRLMTAITIFWKQYVQIMSKP
jgi:hypothetical protein